MYFRSGAGREACRVLCMAAVLTALVSVSCDEQKGARYEKISDESFPVPSIGYDPERYLCRRTPEPVVIDGRLDDRSWNEPWVDWTVDFTDITGREGPAPRYRTRAKMLWDGDYFYIGAELKEAHIWASVTSRDDVIFHDNDFEVFIDPDGDSHQYYELEMNAFGTVWDLFLVKPYRDGGPALDSWDIQGLKSAVHIDGTINDPASLDRSWTVEIAIPWDVLGEAAHKNVPPDEGDVWYVNFSRVEWDIEVEDGKYAKTTDPETGRPSPESNWVWSPQGIVNMHYPEMWGLVMFTNVMKSFGADSFNPSPVEDARWLLRKIYYAQKTHFLQYGRYTGDPARLELEKTGPFGFEWPPVIECSGRQFEAVLMTSDGKTELRIDQDGRLTSTDL